LTLCAQLSQALESGSQGDLLQQKVEMMRRFQADAGTAGNGGTRAVKSLPLLKAIQIEAKRPGSGHRNRRKET